MQLLEARRVGVAVLATALMLAAAGCGGGDDVAAEDGSVAGEVAISGSSTVEPIAVAVAESLADTAPDVVVNIDGPGTGDGFELFCGGETDISNASRAIKDEEAAACDEAGVEFVELQVAYDGLTVMTSADNDAVSCLTFADMYALVGPESQGLERWSDAEALASELGSTTDLPDLELTVVAPGEESGTYDSFIELALAGPAEERLAAGAISEDEAATTRPDYQASGDDNVIVQGIEGAPGSFGWVGFAFAEEAGDAVEEIEVDGGDGCVAASPATITDGSYPLSRPLFIYVNVGRASANPAVAAYVDHFLGDGITAVTDVGYVGLTADQLAATVSAWESR